LFEFGQTLLFDAAEIFEGPAKKQFLDALKRKALSLKEANGNELKTMFFAKPLPTPKQGRIKQGECAIISNIANGNALPGLAAGWRNTMFLAPVINDLGQLFNRERLVHGGSITVNSVTVNKKKLALEKEQRNIGFMPKLISTPTRITAAGNKPKLIDEFIGRVNSSESRLSIAHMRSPSGWVEPGQTPEFDEFTVVLKGALRVTHKQGTLDVGAGQAVVTNAGEWVQYSTSHPEGAEYIAVCLPAFSPQTVHRDA